MSHAPADRGALRARFDEAVREQPGVWRIVHRASGRTLLGSSRNAQGALNRARFELGLGSHRNRRLQADWTADGEAAFDSGVVHAVALREDPAFDLDAELALVLALWRADLPAAAARDGYMPPARPATGARRV